MCRRFVECSETSAHKIQTPDNHPNTKNTTFATRRKFEIRNFRVNFDCHYVVFISVDDKEHGNVGRPNSHHTPPQAFPLIASLIGVKRLQNREYKYQATVQAAKTFEGLEVQSTHS